MTQNDQGDRSSAERDGYPRPVLPGVPTSPPYRTYALIAFWAGLLVAGLNPPGQVARIAVLVALGGACWLIGHWLKRLWRRIPGNRG